MMQKQKFLSPSLCQFNPKIWCAKVPFDKQTLD